MNKKVLVLSVCYAMIISIISISNTDFRIELFVIFGIYTWMILIGLFCFDYNKEAEE